MSLPPPAVVVRYRPQLVIAGFLGVGKTTLLRHLLGALAENGITSDVILNDYENAELDAETVRGKAADVSTLSASCACCGGLEEMVNLALAAQDSRADCLLVELNGTADPIPLIETFSLLDEKIHFRPRWQITVIDARKFGLRGEWQELEDIQLATATHVFVSHKDVVEKPRLAEVRERVRTINPHARHIPVPMLAADINRVVAASRPLVRALESFAPTSWEFSVSRTHGHRLSHAFNSCRILLPDRVMAAAMYGWLRSLPAGVFRIKALVTLHEVPDVRHLYERIGADDFPPSTEVPLSGRVPASAIFIGAGLDPTSLLTTTRDHLGADCSLAT